MNKIALYLKANVADTFVSYSYEIEPQKPEQMGLPKISVHSLGNTIYEPRFTAKNNKLIIQFGHFFGGGTYEYDSILEGKSGLNLYGSGNEDSLISQPEMQKLRDWMKKHQAKIQNKLIK